MKGFINSVQIIVSSVFLAGSIPRFSVYCVVILD
jgi:hypothetical protein